MPDIRSIGSTMKLTQYNTQLVHYFSHFIGNLNGHYIFSRYSY